MPNRSRKKPKKSKTIETHKKNPAAVALGRLGGLKGAVALNESLTPEERSASARRASRARWRKARKAEREAIERELGEKGKP